MPIRVLIAEDEPHLVESLSFVLSREGCEVTSAPDGEAALLSLRTAAPDLMILDVMLPRLNGFELLKRMKADPLLKAIPVIVVTAKGRAQDRRIADEIGVEGFMTKPFSNRDIVDCVRRLTRA